jgi:hypothetical protein
MFFKSKFLHCSILDLLYRGIEKSLKEYLITQEAVANFFPCTAAHVGFSRGDTWTNEIQFDEGEILHIAVIRHDPRLLALKISDCVH